LVSSRCRLSRIRRRPAFEVKNRSEERTVFKTIVIATDGSSYGDRALAYGRTLAESAIHEPNLANAVRSPTWSSPAVCLVWEGRAEGFVGGRVGR
jgi:hypothetical protein